jgi:superfamily II DNA or RNA helicase
MSLGWRLRAIAVRLVFAVEGQAISIHFRSGDGPGSSVSARSSCSLAVPAPGGRASSRRSECAPRTQGLSDEGWGSAFSFICGAVYFMECGTAQHWLNCAGRASRGHFAVQPPATAISEKLLSGAGGWQAMKAARELVQAARVSAASYEPPLLVGQVREGQKSYRAGLRIRSASDIENICTCRDSRQWGKVCAHSLAVGLAWLAPVPVEKPVVPNDNRMSSEARFALLGEPGTHPITLYFILPPHFRSAWAKQQIMICVEAEFGDRRLMLDALPRGQRFGCADFDLDAINSLGTDAAGVNILSAAAFLDWLPAVRGHPRLSFGKSLPVHVSAERFRPRIVIRRAGDSFEFSAQLANNELPLVVGNRAWLLRDGDFLDIGSDLPPRLTKILKDPLLLKSERADEFFSLELPLFREVAAVELSAGIVLPTIEQAQTMFSLTIEGSLQRLSANLRCSYGERPSFPPVSDPANRFVFRDPKEADRLLVRNLTAEKEAVEGLERAGFTRAGDAFEIRDPRRVVRFFAFDFPALPPDWKIAVTPRLEKASHELEPVTPAIEIVRSGEDWFEFKYSVATAAGDGIPLGEVQRLLRSGQNQMRLTNGKTAVLNPDALDDFEQVLRDADPRQSQPGIYRLKRIQAGYLTNTAEEIGAKLVGATAVLRSGKAPEVIGQLGALGRQLRDYQLTGVSWLAALAGQKLGGILADEMGLGKTVQTLAFLRLQRGHGPALIVCPTSLVSNWQREAERFTPELSVMVIDGPDRPEKIARLPEYDLALTSYGLLRRDVELYAGLSLDTVVLDEAQHIKNPETQNAQAAFSLQARQRFVLTGTPMENSVRDLWSLMNFVAPDYLGSRRDFRERYEKPLATQPEPVLQRRLARRLRPFLLRRRKADVARELPAKIEQVVPCELGPMQRATYDALLREIKQGIGLDGASDGATRMKMLTGLLRLRQVCCDLRLLNLPPNEQTDASAKLDLLDELLEEIIDGGHRVLIFSQFVKMLDLLKERLIAREIAHCYLAGLTKHRQQEVDRFQNDATIPVFLISLKAGGVGLNLSAADTVIHFDPWWNAAVEAQATDRAHRIGQTRVVTSYKLIARDTVEEKILNLQKRKRELASAMLESEEPLMSGLTTQDLAELLER